MIVRRGPTEEALAHLARETGAEAVFYNRLYEPDLAARDERVGAALRDLGLVVSDHPDALLFEPQAIQKKSGGPFQVFTRFWKACLAAPELPRPHPAPRKLTAPDRWPESLALEDLDLLPRIDWTAGLRAAWPPGEAGARDGLRRFVGSALADYATDRDRPDRPGTSRLSPHLHFGEVSIRRVWWTVQDRALRAPMAAGSVDTYLAELGWREFAYHLLHHFPHTVKKPLRPEFARFPWKSNRRALAAWKTGRTGYPLVDAGLRELWTTGWMHNRVRMVVASFLVKHLLLPWQEGAAWFHDTLVDADLASNTMGWQWTAGSGADAAPYFRIFNPVRQGERFDPDGTYVRRWVPELAPLPDRWIHRPWETPAGVLEEAGVALDRDYPRPLVDHTVGRDRALAAYERLKKTPGRNVGAR